MKALDKIAPTRRNAPEQRTAAMEKGVAQLAAAGPDAIDARLAEIAAEWSAGRMTKATAGVLILGGLGLSRFVSPRFGALPIVGGLVLTQYLFGKGSITGELFRELGFRSGAEIDHERVALKALRGDFKHLPTVHEIEDREAITRMEGEGGIVVEPDEAKVDAHSAAKTLVAAAHPTA